MPDPKTRPPIPSSDPSLDDDDAPISDARPSSPAADSALLGMLAPSNDADAPLSDLREDVACDSQALPRDAPAADATDAPSSDDVAAIPVTRELTNAFLAKKSTQDRIRQVVECRVPRGTQEADVENLIQDASLRAMTTTELAKSAPGMRPWISRIAQNLVIDQYRADAKHLKWLDRSVDVQELPPDLAFEGGEEAEQPPEDPTAPPRPVEQVNEQRLTRWLETHVKTKADRLTLEMLKQKATSGATNAQIAAEFGMTEAAFDNRVLRFKVRWVPVWKRSDERRQRAIVVWLLRLGGLLLAVALAWWLLHGAKRTMDIGPTVVPLLRPVPTASASATPDPFNQADPTDPANEKKPERLKP